MTAAIDLDVAVDVLRELESGLGDVDPDTRALVGLTLADDGHVQLTDVELADNGVLTVPEATAGIVVVTGEVVEVDDGTDLVPMLQYVAVLRSGEEAGLVRLADDREFYLWRTDEDIPDAAALRPRDLTANAARRALGLPSLADPPPVTDLFARVWLLRATSLALELFDQPDGSADVEPDVLEDALADEGALEFLDETGLTWEVLRERAAAGGFAAGPYRVDAEHAAWLDADGFAQYVDQTVLSTEELLSTLEIVGGDDLVAWAIDELITRGWYRPEAA